MAAHLGEGTEHSDLKTWAGGAQASLGWQTT